MQLLVSIIIPVYNVEKYLCECLESVINQTYQNLEIILVDDGSPDKCGEICDAYAAKDHRIRVIHQQNKGVSAARNIGIDNANGEWVYFMDSDDWVELDLVERTVENAKKTETDMVFFAHDNVYGKSATRRCTLGLENDREPCVFSNMGQLDTFMVYANKGSMCACIVRADMLKKIRFNTSLVINEDYLVRLQLYQKISSFSYIPDTLYHYRSTPTSATRRKDWYKLLYAENDAVSKEIKLVRSGGFPEGAEISIHTYYLTLMYILFFANVMDNPKLSFHQKRIKYIEFIQSDVYQEYIQSYNPNFLHGVARIMLQTKKASNIRLLTVHLLRKTMRCCRTIKSNIMNGFK